MEQLPGVDMHVRDRWLRCCGMSLPGSSSMHESSLRVSQKGGVLGWVCGSAHSKGAATSMLQLCVVPRVNLAYAGHAAVGAHRYLHANSTSGGGVVA